MLTVFHLTKRYKNVVANYDLNFSVASGEIAVLVGPNGAGKSTAIKCIAGLLRYEGDIYIEQFKNKTLEAKKLFGYIPEIPAPFELLTVWEHMEFFGRAYRIENWQQRAEDLLGKMQLLDKKDKLGKELSKGMQQKLSICCALLPKPQVVLFDEPLVGLDPHAIKELKKMILEMKAQGASILISTHMLESVEELWDKVLIMMNGRVAAMRTKEEIALSGENLQDLFFAITEGNGKQSSANTQ